MGKNIRHYELPVPSTGSVTDASLHVHGRTALIRFDYYRDGEPRKSGICFVGTSATRERSERCCTSWHVRPYDVLVEVTESSWVEMQRNEIAERYREEFVARHFAIYLDSVGCFEVLATDFEVIPEKAGSWEELNRILMSK